MDGNNHVDGDEMAVEEEEENRSERRETPPERDIYDFPLDSSSEV